MIDTLILPETDDGFNRLLVVFDLWSKEVDFEPLVATPNQYDPKTGLKVSKDNGEQYNNWNDTLPELKKELNKKEYIVYSI